MDKSILYQYIDACELIKDTEKEIQKIKQKRKNIVQDKVKGSMYDFPFAPQSFVIRGIEYSEDDEKKLREQEQLLEEQKAAAETIKLEVEGWMAAIPSQLYQALPFIITALVLIFSSMKKKKNSGQPAGLGLNYFREER